MMSCLALVVALATAPACQRSTVDTSPAIVADSISLLRTSSDTAILNRISRRARRWLDGRIFSAAVSVAGDSSATTEARVFAIRTLLEAAEPGLRMSYADLASPDESKWSCSGMGVGTDGDRPTVQPLPADYVTQLRALGAQLALSAGSPIPVRLGGECLKRVPAP